MKTIVVGGGERVSQCKKPRGWLGRFVLWKMNSRHSKLTDWGLSNVSIEENYTILDVGCGGGRTLSKLAAAAKQGKVYGVDYSEESVAASRRTNAHWINVGRVEVQHGSVSQLPFPDRTFDLVTAVETHFWWPDLPADLREILRVLKPGARLTVIAEVYKGANTNMARLCEQYASRTGMALLDVGEHRELFTRAGYSWVETFLDESKGWICVVGERSGL
jgi:ubiquinone/menaquinone biosynthesis C-methylase UbiE